MRALPLMMAALTLCALARLAGAQTPGPWSVEVSAAHVFGWVGSQDDARHMARSGVAWNATVGRQALSWLAITGDVAVLQVDERLRPSGDAFSVSTVDDATHATLMMGVRIERPVRFGLAPSFELGAGLGRLHWGERRVTFIGAGDTWIYLGDEDVAWGWSAAFQLRFATRRRILAPVVRARMIVFDEQGAPVRMTSLGFGLRF